MCDPETSQPVRDPESGQPVFLTLEQAEREFDRIVQNAAAAAVTTTGSDEEDEGDGGGDGDRKQTKTPSWSDVGINHPTLLRNLEEIMDCPAPMAVQTKCCPAVLGISDNDIDNGDSRDVLVGTYTGSGKTLAFILPAIVHIVSQEPLAAGPGATASEESR